MPELQERYDKLVEGAEKGWRPEDGDFERVLTALVGFGKRELLGETGRIGEWCSCTVDEARPASSSLTLLRLDLQGRRSEDQSRSIRSVDADCLSRRLAKSPLLTVAFSLVSPGPNERPNQEEPVT